MCYYLDMNTDLLHAKEALLAGATYTEAAKIAGIKYTVDLYALLKNDPDIVAAKDAGVIRTRKAAVKGPRYYANKAHVRAVLEQGMTHTEAAKAFGVSQPLVSRHVKLALQGYEKSESPPPQPQPQTTNPLNDVDQAIRAAMAAGHSREDVLQAVLAAMAA